MKIFLVKRIVMFKFNYTKAIHNPGSSKDVCVINCCRRLNIVIFFISYDTIIYKKIYIFNKYFLPLQNSLNIFFIAAREQFENGKIGLAVKNVVHYCTKESI